MSTHVIEVCIFREAQNNLQAQITEAEIEKEQLFKIVATKVNEKC